MSNKNAKKSPNQSKELLNMEKKSDRSNGKCLVFSEKNCHLIDSKCHFKLHIYDVYLIFNRFKKTFCDFEDDERFV